MAEGALRRDSFLHLWPRLTWKRRVQWFALVRLQSLLLVAYCTGFLYGVSEEILSIECCHPKHHRSLLDHIKRRRTRRAAWLVRVGRVEEPDKG